MVIGGKTDENNTPGKTLRARWMLALLLAIAIPVALAGCAEDEGAGDETGADDETGVGEEEATGDETPGFTGVLALAAVGVAGALFMARRR